MLQQAAWSKPKLLVQRRLQLLLVVYLYNVEAETFLPIPDMPAELPAQIAAAKQVLQQINGGDCHGNAALQAMNVAHTGAAFA